jgi:hypothetical protein
MDMRVLAKFVIWLGAIALVIGVVIYGRAAAEANRLTSQADEHAVRRVHDAGRDGSFLYSPSQIQESANEHESIAQAESLKPTAIWLMAGGAAVTFLGFGLRAAARASRET